MMRCWVTSLTVRLTCVCQLAWCIAVGRRIVARSEVNVRRAWCLVDAPAIARRKRWCWLG